MSLKCCIVIPVYNEARAIGSLVKALIDRRLDVFVIDDGSTDGSGDLAEAQGARVIRTGSRQGKGAALRLGFDEALMRSYTGVLAMDGDGQHAVEDVDAFLAVAAENGPCIITGNRLTHSKNMPWLRRWINRLMSWMISAAMGCKVPDTQCGFRYISREVLETVSVITRSFEVETEILLKAARHGYPIFSIPVKCIYGDEVSRIKPFADTIKFIRYFFKDIFIGR